MDTKGLPSPEDLAAYSKLDGGESLTDRIIAEWLRERRHRMEKASLQRLFEHQQEMDVLETNRTMMTLSYLTLMVLVASFALVVGLVLGNAF